MTLLLLSAGFVAGIFAGMALIAAILNRYIPSQKDMIERDLRKVKNNHSLKINKS